MVAHLPDALAAAVADPDACTARCLTRLAEEDSRAEQPSWHVEAAVWRPIRTTRTPSTTPCRSWLGWRTKRWSSGHPGPGEGDEVVLAAAASSPRSFSTTP